jgi:hypothetical protein
VETGSQTIALHETVRLAMMFDICNVHAISRDDGGEAGNNPY